jgi:hypothetical protein
VRPYANVEEYLAAEAWTVDARTMLLVGESGLAPDSAIVFDVTLADGARPIKAEARVSGVVEPMDGKPGGIRVRFRRYGAPTKAFIERAMTFVASGVDTGPPPPPAGPPEPSGPGLSAPDASAVVHEPPREVVVVPQPASGHADVPRALASLRVRAAAPPETPPNREYLLEKLRQRGTNEDVTMRYQRDE